MGVGISQPLFVVPSSHLNVDIECCLVVGVVRNVAWRLLDLLLLLLLGGSGCWGHVIKVISGRPGCIGGQLIVEVPSSTVVQGCVVHSSVARVTTRSWSWRGS